MKSILTSLLTAWVLLLNTGAFAQELSGTWVGNFKASFLTPTPEKLVVELQLHDDSLLTGASHLYYKNNKYEHYTLVGIVRWRDSSVYFREDSTLGVDLGWGNGNCLGNYTTYLRITDTSWRLEGRWKSNYDLFHGGGCPPTKVWLAKPVQKAPKPKRRDPNLDRKSDIQSLIEISNAERDSVKIEIYDNAEVDGDIVSVYFNDSTMIHRQKITATPQVFYVALGKEEPMYKIKMAAESTGAFPPCTALMVITTRRQQYKITLSSSYSSNAEVELFLKK